MLLGVRSHNSRDRAADDDWDPIPEGGSAGSEAAETAEIPQIVREAADRIAADGKTKDGPDRDDWATERRECPRRHGENRIAQKNLGKELALRAREGESGQISKGRNLKEPENDQKDPRTDRESWDGTSADDQNHRVDYRNDYLKGLSVSERGREGCSG